MRECKIENGECKMKESHHNFTFYTLHFTL